jgi:hypothetical protein
MRASREEWRKRVERWKDSGLTAEQYASELGINAKTLQFWKYKLRTTEPLSRRPPKRSTRERRSGALPVVELAPVMTMSGATFELELGGGRRLRIPGGFDEVSLERLLAVLRRAT